MSRAFLRTHEDPPALRSERLADVEKALAAGLGNADLPSSSSVAFLQSILIVFASMQLAVLLSFLDQTIVVRAASLYDRQGAITPAARDPSGVVLLVLVAGADAQTQCRARRYPTSRQHSTPADPPPSSRPPISLRRARCNLCGAA